MLNPTDDPLTHMCAIPVEDAEGSPPGVSEQAFVTGNVAGQAGRQEAGDVLVVELPPLSAGISLRR